MNLETSRLLMRRPCIDDCMFLEDLWRNIKVRKYLGGTVAEELISQKTSALLAHWDLHQFGLYTVLEKMETIMKFKKDDIEYATFGLIYFGGLCGSIGAGAGIGALLGTFVFPGLGTAFGASIGALWGFAIGFVISGLLGQINNLFNPTPKTQGLFQTMTIFGAIALSGLIAGLFSPFPAIGFPIGFIVGIVTTCLIGLIGYCIKDNSLENHEIQNDPIVIKNSYTTPGMSQAPIQSNSLEENPASYLAILETRKEEKPFEIAGDPIEGPCFGMAK